MDTKAVKFILFITSVVFTLCDAASQPYRCRLTCPRDQEMDTTRCRCISISQRRPSIYWDLRCPSIYCPFSTCSSYKKDSNGCTTCECECNRRVCPSNCPLGTQSTVDRQGCSVCSCRSVSPRNFCRQQQQCRLFCPNGFQTDDNGCQICQCKTQKCGGLCRNLCLNGRVYDSNGCPTCTCKRYK